MFGKFLARRSERKNAAYPPVTGYIRTQNESRVKVLSYGIKNMDYNGCEVIAAYHARLTLGDPIPLAKVAYEICSLPFALWFLGIFGSYPSAAPRYLKKLGYSVRRCSHRELHRKKPLPDGENVYVYTYWNPRFYGIHTVELHGTDKGFTVCNYVPLWGKYFPTATELLAHIPSPLPIRLTAIKKA